MGPFSYVLAENQDHAVSTRGSEDGPAFIAGGTTLIDLMKLNVETHDRLVDINGLPLGECTPLPDGGLRVGAMVRNTELAYHPSVVKNYPLLSQAILSGASPQLRNMATTGGNLMQRTRCNYFRDVSFPCNKRTPGSGCSAMEGYNRIHAILGTSDKCIATHPSDMCVAFAAMDVVVRVKGNAGARVIPFRDFHVPYGEDPARETTLQPGELIIAVDLPPPGFFARSLYLKIRDRAEYEFALSSAAVALEMNGGTIRRVRLALGGVATKPWRASAAEKVLTGAKPSDDLYAAAADAELHPALPRAYNAFKIPLCKNTIIRAMQMAVAMA